MLIFVMVKILNNFSFLGSSTLVKHYLTVATECHEPDTRRWRRRCRWPAARRC